MSTSSDLSSTGGSQSDYTASTGASGGAPSIFSSAPSATSAVIISGPSETHPKEEYIGAGTTTFNSNFDIEDANIVSIRPDAPLMPTTSLELPYVMSSGRPFKMPSDPTSASSPNTSSANASALGSSYSNPAGPPVASAYQHINPQELFQAPPPVTLDATESSHIEPTQSPTTMSTTDMDITPPQEGPTSPRSNVFGAGPFIPTTAQDSAYQSTGHPQVASEPPRERFQLLTEAPEAASGTSQNPPFAHHLAADDGHIRTSPTPQQHAAYYSPSNTQGSVAEGFGMNQSNPDPTPDSAPIPSSTSQKGLNAPPRGSVSLVGAQNPTGTVDESISAPSGFGSNKVSSGGPRRPFGSKDSSADENMARMFAVDQRANSNSNPRANNGVPAEPNQFPRQPHASRLSSAYPISGQSTSPLVMDGTAPFASSTSPVISSPHYNGTSPSAMDQTQQQRGDARLQNLEYGKGDARAFTQGPGPAPSLGPRGGASRDPISGYLPIDPTSALAGAQVSAPGQKHALGPQNSQQHYGALAGGVSAHPSSHGAQMLQQPMQYPSGATPPQNQGPGFGTPVSAPPQRFGVAAPPPGVTGPPAPAPWKYTSLPALEECDMRYSRNNPVADWSQHDAKWDANHVKMPCSSHNRVYSPHNVAQPISRWSIICSRLKETTFQSSHQLEEVIRSYNPTYSSHWARFDALHKLVALDRTFLTHTLRYIIELATAMEPWFFQAIPLLRAQSSQTLIFSQQQCLILVANMFLCTFPRRVPHHWNGKANEYSNFPNVGFDGLFTRDEDSSLAKLQCFVAYFNYHRERAQQRLPPLDREVRFTRKVLFGQNLFKWTKCNAPISSFSAVPNRGLEDMTGMWQADFANKMIGGGTLGRGSVQEEIRFSISPELLISRLFTEELAENEALLMTGSQQYSSYSGYAREFRFSGKYDDPHVLPHTHGMGGSGMQSHGTSNTGGVTKVIALDAIDFSTGGRSPIDQFNATETIRELNKAYAAFVPANETERSETVATGKWGCGVFKGNNSWKFLIQLLACSAAGRSMAFCTLTDTQQTQAITQFSHFLDRLPSRPTVQTIVRIMSAYRPRSDTDDVLPYIMRELSPNHEELQRFGPAQSAGYSHGQSPSPFASQPAMHLASPVSVPPSGQIYQQQPSQHGPTAAYPPPGQQYQGNSLGPRGASAVTGPPPSNYAPRNHAPEPVNSHFMAASPSPQGPYQTPYSSGAPSHASPSHALSPSYNQSPSSHQAVYAHGMQRDSHAGYEEAPSHHSGHHGSSAAAPSPYAALPPSQQQYVPGRQDWSQQHGNYEQSGNLKSSAQIPRSGHSTGSQY